MDQVSFNFIDGTIQINKYGEGFIQSPVEGQKDIYIPRAELNGALDGDEVSIVLLDEYQQFQNKIKVRDKLKDRQVGSVYQIKNRNVSNIVGEIKKDKNGFYFDSKDSRKLNIKLDTYELSQHVEGEIILVECVEDLGNNTYLGKIKRSLGHKDDPRMDIISLYASKGIIDEFPEDVIEELETIPTKVSERDMEGRLDLRDRMIFTIDGSDTKDIDDAISLDRDSKGNYILGVHIADVTNYVKEGSSLDKEALRRGTSCYPPGAVIPMLPHQLSNGICSLNEGVDRLAVSCFIKISPEGKILSSKAVNSIIKSNKKMTYKAVNSIIERDVIPEGYEPYAKKLKDMHELSLILRGLRKDKGAMSFDNTEVKFKFDENGKPVELYKVERGEGEKLIEDFMIAANEETAKMLYNHKRKTGLELPGIYRIHEKPSIERVLEFTKMLDKLGHKVKGDITSVKFDTFTKILNQVDYYNEYEQTAIGYNAVRAQNKAKYSNINEGHYGLASSCYSHFTSPIRRYPDLQLHRLIKKFIIEKRMDAKTIAFYKDILPDVAYQSSKCEKNADSAEYEAISMKMAEYMLDHIGEEYEAHIMGIKDGSIFIRLSNNVEGLVRGVDLQTKYHMDEDNLRLTDKKTKEMLTIGSPIMVRCSSADKDSKKIDFVLADQPELSLEKPKVLARKKNGRN